jgi:FdhD protein
MSATTSHTVTKITGGQASRMEDVVAREVRLTLAINGERVLSLSCTPLMVRELVVGFVMTEGIAEGICTERMSIVYGGDEVSVDVHAEGEVRAEGGTVTSGCVGGISYARRRTTLARTDPLRIAASALRDLFHRFQHRSDLYNATGCIHSAALADTEEMLAFAEDIGRHNAVDKAIGLAILEGVEFGGKLLLASGRLSSEIVSKCAAWGIPLVASRTAPTALALSIAEESGITVAGFVRGDRMNVYTHPERITI